MGQGIIYNCTNTRELVLLIICPTLRSVIKATQWLKRTGRSSKSSKVNSH